MNYTEDGLLQQTTAEYLPIHIILMRSQSGQIQVGPLLIPHLFSAKHSGHI